MVNFNITMACNRPIIWIIALTLLFSITCITILYAAQAPSTQEAGAEAARFEKTIEKTRRTFEETKPKPPPIEVKKEEEKAVAGEVSFVLKGLAITGATVFRHKVFEPIYKPYIGQEVTFKDLESIIVMIKSKYKEKGYLTTTAYLPEQDIAEGKIVIKVLEGKMGKVSIEGNKWTPAPLIKKGLHVKKNEILDVVGLQRDILRLNQNPDIEAKAVLMPGTEPETSDVMLTVKDYFPWHVGVSVDNQGSRLVGKDRTLLTLRGTDATGHNDSLFGTMLFARRSDAQAIGYAIPTDTYGTKFGCNFVHFHMDLGKEFTASNITGDTKILSPYITREIVLSDATEVYVNAGIDIKSVVKHINGVKTSDDELRIPYFGVEVTVRDPSGETSFSPRFNFGTSGFLGASSRNHPTASRGETGGSFLKYEHEVRRIQRMPFDSYSITRSQFQISTHTLTPSEQLQIGGANSVRGYPEGDFLADVGAVVNFDWIFPMYFIPKSLKLPHSDVPLCHQIEPIIFVDFGCGRLNKKFPGERRDKFLMGVGGGLRIRLYKNLFCRFEWADAIGADPLTGAGPSTFNFSVQSEI